MSPLSSHALEMQQPPTRWDHILEGLVILLLAFLPFAFGGRDEIGPEPTLTLVSGWSHEIFIGMAALMAAVLAARQFFQRDARFVWSWAYLPIVLFILLAALQLVPLPDRIVASLSPRTLGAKRDLLGDLPNAGSLLHSLTLSFYPQATWLDLRKLLAVATVFVVVVNVYRRSLQIKRLLLAVSVIGFAVALLALYQNAFDGRTIYGIVRAAHPNSGPFLNHSHFGQFMNLSIGAMIGLLLVRVEEIVEGSDTFGDSFQLLRYAKLNGVYLLAVMALLSAATIFFSMTRGGVVSMLIAASLTASVYVVRRGRGSAGTVLFVLAALALLVVLYAGFGLVYERLATLRGAAEHNGDRMQVIRDLSLVWRQYPIWGTGLGTHRYIFPQYDHSTIYALSTYAENEYAQLMEEAGAAGLALCLSFVAIVAASYLRILRHPRRPIHYAAYGLGYGLLAILIHSASDFGQHDPANACLTAAYAALLIVLARHARPIAEQQKGRSAPRQRPLAVRVPLGIAGLAAVAGIFVMPLRTANGWRRARADWAGATAVQASLNARGWSNGSKADYARLLGRADAAVEIQPNDAVMRYWTNEFHWQALNLKRSAKTGALSLPVADVERIVAGLNRARAACPTFAPVYALAGQLDYFLLHKPEGDALIRTGYRLDHNEPVSCEAVAQLDAAEAAAQQDPRSSKDLWDASLENARRALALDRSMLAGSLSAYVRRGRPELAYQLVKGDREGLELLQDMLAADPEQSALASQCERDATDLLMREASAPDASAGVLARAAEIHEQRGEHALAIDRYERALAKNYGALDWRLNLAKLLAKSGKDREAERELEACLRQRPNWEPAQSMLAELNASRPSHVQ